MKQWKRYRDNVITTVCMYAGQSLQLFVEKDTFFPGKILPRATFAFPCWNQSKSHGISRNTRNTNTKTRFIWRKSQMNKAKNTTTGEQCEEKKSFRSILPASDKDAQSMLARRYYNEKISLFSRRFFFWFVFSVYSHSSTVFYGLIRPRLKTRYYIPILPIIPQILIIIIAIPQRQHRLFYTY